MGLILSPSEVRTECAYLRTALNSNIEAYRNAQEKVREFVDDGRLNSQAWEEMKDNVNVCYQLVVEGVLLAHDDIMSDMDNLEGVIGDEYLNENELCKKIRLLEKECKRYENILQQMEVWNAGSQGMKECLDGMIEITKEEIAILNQKKDFLYEVESNTKLMFAAAVDLLGTVSNIISYEKTALNKGQTVLAPELLDSLRNSYNDCIAKINGSTGKVLEIPNPGDTITVSRGIDLEDEYVDAVVSQWNAWSREYSIVGCNTSKKTAGKLCCRRLNYAVDNYTCNKDDDDLLMFDLEGYDEVVFAGAMVEGYADIGDIVRITLDDGNEFNFLILDVKSTQHTAADLKKDGQIQCEWGHGYMVNENTVQLSVCEFITAGNYVINSAQDAKSGKFLLKRRVVSAEIIDSIPIDDSWVGSDNGNEK